jgi:ABC-type multidrug transport system fused ATPase/permease subunit
MLTGLTYFSIYSDTEEQKWKTKAEDLIYTAMKIYGGLAILCLITFTFFYGFFSEAGEHITKKLRTRLYEKFITNDMEFFDVEENGPGNLAVKLSNDCNTVNS